MASINLSRINENSIHTHENATSLINGFMTSSMFNKLYNIEDQANRIIVDSILSSSSTNPLQNKVIEESLRKIYVNGTISESDKEKNPEDFTPGYYHIDGGYCRLENGWPCNAWQAELLVLSTEINDGANSLGYKHLFVFAQSDQLFHKMKQYKEWGNWTQIYTTNNISIAELTSIRNFVKNNSAINVQTYNSIPQSLSNGQIGLIV